jgi:SAM-dependent methyltransferase
MMNDKLTDGHKDGGLPASEWAGGSGERWLANLDGLERMIEPIGTALLTQAGYRPGERVIDIGCGGGWTSRQIARAVGPDGAVTGLDISPALVEAALARRGRGIANIAFELGDAGVAMPRRLPSIACSRASARCSSTIPMRPLPICAAWSPTAAGSISRCGQGPARTLGS